MQVNAKKQPTSTPCRHPLCGDSATYYERVARGAEARPHCRAHHLEWKYLQHVQRLRDRYQPRTRAVMPCGTAAAAARHRRRKEPVCDPCRLADNARTTEWKARNRDTP